MSNRGRWFLAAWGGIDVGLAVIGLAGVLFMYRLYAVSGSDSVARLQQFAGATLNCGSLSGVLLGMSWLVTGLFLCVKALCNPPQFWWHTGWHLLITSALAWAITTALFVAIALMP